ncbi:MAG TPA: hypothetical protein VJN95_05685 [Gemmatimonadales bacterium]|nr:hypothetical protein [Gemmatimonadales bacterium]
MIHRLRSAHRVIWAAAVILLPAIIGTGLQARHPAPLVAAPSIPAAEALAPGTTWWTGAGVLTVTPLRIIGDSVPAIEVAFQSTPGAPDLLLYWTRRDEGSDSNDVLFPAVSSDVLLGPAEGKDPKVVRLPAEAKGGESALVLYSLGHRELLGRMPLTDGRPHAP